MNQYERMIKVLIYDSSLKKFFENFPFQDKLYFYKNEKDIFSIK